MGHSQQILLPSDDAAGHMHAGGGAHVTSVAYTISTLSDCVPNDQRVRAMHELHGL